MPAMSSPPLPPSSPPGPILRKRGRPRSANLRDRPDRVALAVEVLAALAGLPPTHAVGELAEALRWPSTKLSPVLEALERSGLVERWPDPSSPGDVRAMLSAVALARLGLRLAPRGDRWNPDRPAAARLRSRAPHHGR